MNPFILITTQPGKQIGEPYRFIVSEKTTWATLEKVVANSEVALVSETVMDRFQQEITQWYQQNQRCTYIVAKQPTQYKVPTLICPSEIESAHDFEAYWPNAPLITYDYAKAPIGFKRKTAWYPHQSTHHMTNLSTIATELVPANVSACYVNIHLAITHSLVDVETLVDAFHAHYGDELELEFAVTMSPRQKETIVVNWCYTTE